MEDMLKGAVDYTLAHSPWAKSPRGANSGWRGLPVLPSVLDRQGPGNSQREVYPRCRWTSGMNWWFLLSGQLN